MAGIIVIVFVGWIVSATIRTMIESKKAKLRLDRLEENDEILAQNILQMKREAKRAASRQSDFETRWAKYTEEAKKEMDKQAKAQERIEKALEKQEEQMRKMEQKFYTASQEVEFQKEQIDRLQAVLERIELERDACANKSENYYKFERKAITLNNQIRTAYRKMDKARFDRDEAERKLKEVA